MLQIFRLKPDQNPINFLNADPTNMPDPDPEPCLKLREKKRVKIIYFDVAARRLNAQGD